MAPLFKSIPKPRRLPKPLRSTVHRIPDKLRAEVYERDGYTCRWCGRFGGRLDLHHRLARSQGGKDSKDNLISVDRICHGTIHGIPLVAKARGFILEVGE